jgi:hypothetical protein
MLEYLYGKTFGSKIARRKHTTIRKRRKIGIKNNSTHLYSWQWMWRWGQSAAGSSLDKAPSQPLKRGLGKFSRRSGHTGEESNLLLTSGERTMDFRSVK